MATTTQPIQPTSPDSSVQRLRVGFRRLLRSLLSKIKVPTPSEEVVGVSEELGVRKVPTIGNGDGDKSPLASTTQYQNGPTPHRDNDTSLSSEAPGGPYGVPSDLHPAPVRPSMAASAPEVSPEVSRELDVSTPFLCHDGPPYSPQSVASGPDLPSGSSSPLTKCDDLNLERERRNNLLDLERERTRIKLLELERERMKINLLELERERRRINLLDQRMVALPYVMRSNVRGTFAPPETRDEPQSWDFARSDYRADGASAQFRHFPTDLSNRSLSDAWATSFRSGLGSVA